MARILYAEDDEIMAELVVHRLKQEGHQIEHVTNGRDALDRLLTGKFDLVLLDVIMPEMDGMETLKKIQENPEIADIPVIMLTGKSESQYVISGLKSGAVDYITKPFDFDVLIARIDNALRQKEKFEILSRQIALRPVTREHGDIIKKTLEALRKHWDNRPEYASNFLNMILFASLSISPNFWFYLYQIGRIIGEQIDIECDKELDSCLRSLLKWMEERGFVDVNTIKIEDDIMDIEFSRTMSCISSNEHRFPCAHLERGIISGFLTLKLGRLAVVEEVRCKATGDPVCEFRIKLM